MHRKRIPGKWESIKRIIPEPEKKPRKRRHRFALLIRGKKRGKISRRLQKRIPKRTHCFASLPPSRDAVPGASRPPGSVIHLNFPKLLSRRDCCSCKFSPPTLQKCRQRRGIIHTLRGATQGNNTMVQRVLYLCLPHETRYVQQNSGK